MRLASLAAMLLLLGCDSTVTSDPGGLNDGAGADGGTDDSGFGADAAPFTGTPGADAGTQQPTATCTSVVHIGDALTSIVEQPLADAYQAAGITATINSYAGRTLVSKIQTDPYTGEEAALALRASRPDCWVVALGTNDAAAIAAGADVTAAMSIDRMMFAIDDDELVPVIWIDTHSTLASGYWAATHMEAWNDALDDAKARWPNLRVFEWSAIAATGSAPYYNGVFHTAEGFAVRNAAIVEAVK